MFNDWPQYGYDAEHDDYNPNSAAFSPTNLAKLHDAGLITLNDTNTQTQPIVASNVAGHAALLFVGGGSGTEYAYDALTEALVWQRRFGQQAFTCASGAETTIGVAGSSAYDAANQAVYFVDGANTTVNGPSTIDLEKLLPSNGATLGSVNLVPILLPGESDSAHTSVTLGSGGRVFAGTASTCDVPTWRGRVAAVNGIAMSAPSIFFTTYGQGGHFGGGGVWGWAGATLDPSGNVYVGVGNADASGTAPSSSFQATLSEQAGYGENLVEVSNDLSTVSGHNYPGFSFGGTSTDLDLVGSPVVFTPTGCPELIAVQGKSGGIYFYDAATISSGPIGSFQFGESSSEVGYAGNLGFSPATNTAYVDVNASTAEGSIEPPGMVTITFPGCVPTLTDHVAFGVDSYSLSYTQPRSAPTVTAGGLVFVSSPNTSGGGDVYVLNAITLAVLNGGVPLFSMPAVVRMAPVVDGNWLFVMDQNGDLARWTLDPTYHATQAQLLRARAHRPVRSIDWRPPQTIGRP